MNTPSIASGAPGPVTTDPPGGTGIGLRGPHIPRILAERPAIPWLEVLADNHVAAGGPVPAQLEAIRTHYPITLHCVGMSLGGVDPLDWDYLGRIRSLRHRYQAAWVSDHLCFTRNGGRHYHDLLPLPYTEEAIAHVAERIARVQDFLGERLLIENVSSYLTYRQSAMTEAEFVTAVLERADCDLLLDVNNIHVSAHNHGFSARDYLDAVPLRRVRQVHLAGYSDQGDYLLDAHDAPVADPVWALYRDLVERLPGIPALIEWDNDLPDLDELLREAARADRIAREAGR